MAIPTTRQELIDYCLRKLGHPVINVSVAAEQLDDRVDEALSIFSEHHYDGSVEEWVAYTVTDTDITNGYITVPDDILVVAEIIPAKGIGSSSSSSEPQFTYEYQSVSSANQWGSFSSTSSSNFALTQMLRNDSMSNLAVTPTFEFQRHGSQLRVYDSFESGFELAVRVYRILDPDTNFQVWNDRWLKLYLTALIKKQWGENTKKYSGIQLLGGVTINGEQIFNEALTDIENLETELYERYNEPTRFFMG